MQFRFSLRTGLALLLGTFLIALVSVRLMSWFELRHLSVTGPIYHRIVESQELMIDAMPPSLYASEAYIAIHQYLDADLDVKREQCRTRYDRVRQQFLDAFEKWQRRIGPKEFQSTLGKSFESGRLFFHAVDTRLFPMAEAKVEHAKIEKLLLDEIDPIFEEHRSEITEGMQRALGRLQAEERLAKESSQVWWSWHLVFDLFWIGLLGLIIWTIGRRVWRLQREKDRLLLVSNVSSTIFIITDREGKITWTNAGFKMRTGYEPHEVNGHSLVHFLVKHGIDQKAQQIIEQVLQTGNSCKFNITSHCRQGRQFVSIMEMQPVCNDVGTLEGFVSILSDITLQATLHSRIASIYSSLSEGIVLQGLDGQIIDCNPAAEKLLGLSRKSILARSSVDKRWHAIHADGSEWEGSTHPSMETLRTGQPIHDAIMGLEFQNGERRWISINTEPILSATGELSAVVASFSDISKVLAQKERLDMATRGAGLAIWEWHVELDQLMIAGKEGPLAETTESHAYTRAHWRSQIHPEDLPQAERALESHLLGNDIDYRSEHRMRGPKGEWMWVLEAGRIVERNSQSRPIRLAGIHLDITRSKSMEQRIRESEMRTRMIIDTAMDAVVCLDPRGNITEWNAVAEKIFGFTLPEATGKPLSFFIQPCESSPPDRFSLEAIFAGDSSLLGTRVEVKGLRRDGTILAVELSINPLELRGEISFTAFLRDITEQRNLEMQLAQSQRLESIGQLAAGVAHEINTPVQFVNDSVHFLNEGFQDLLTMVREIRNLGQQPYGSPEVVEMVAKIQELDQQADAEYLSNNVPKAIDRAIQGLNRISEIVRSMRDFSHPVTGPHTYVDINRSLQSTITVARTEYKYVADVETDFGDVPNVLGNSGELNQVFLNILINAAHAIESKIGKSGARGRIFIQTRWEHEQVVVRIQDTGCGIPLDIRHRIFEPFFTTKEVGKGTGQGLAIAYNIIQNKHGGQIEFESQIDVGSTFTIRLHRDGPDGRPLEQQEAEVKV